MSILLIIAIIWTITGIISLWEARRDGYFYKLLDEQAGYLSGPLLYSVANVFLFIMGPRLCFDMLMDYISYLRKFIIYKFICMKRYFRYKAIKKARINKP